MLLRSATVLCFSLLLPFALAGGAPAVESAAASATPAALVEQLGDPTFSARAAADAELRRIGIDAREALLAGLDSEDAEVQRSCRRILAYVLKADYERRLGMFVRDGDSEHHLPGWERYRELIGDSQDDRELFVQMHRAEAGLMESYAAGPAAAAEAIMMRFEQMFRSASYGVPQRTPPSIGTVAAIFFVGTDKELKLSESVVDSNYWSSIAGQGAFMQALQSGRFQRQSRILLGEWILLPSSPNHLNRKLTLAMQYDVPQALPLAERTADDADLHPNYRAVGIHAMAKIGGKKYAPKLATYLDDEAVCQQRFVRVNNVNQQVAIEVRDIALGWLVYLTDQKHSDYKMPNAQVAFDRVKRTPAFTINAYYLGFNSKEDREFALNKWAEYVEKHPLDQLAEVEASPEVQPAAPAENEGAAAVLPGRLQMAFAALPAALPAVAGGAIKADDAASEAARPGLMQLAEREHVHLLSEARRMIGEERYALAVTYLGEILADENDYVYQPDRKIPLLRGLKREADELIAGLPQEGRDAYRLAYGPGARAALQEAVDSSDTEKIASVAVRYFHTQAGAEAAFLVGTHYLNLGHPLRAAFFLQRLRDRSADREQFEPSLSLKLAACWAMAGLPEDAEQVLLELKARSPGGRLRIGGEEVALFSDPRDALDWLAAIVGRFDLTGGAQGWVMFRGDATRNTESPPGGPYLRTKPLTTVIDDLTTEALIGEIDSQQRKEHLARLPSLSPLVVGEVIVIRTATHLRGLDRVTLKLIWESPLEDTLTWIVNDKFSTEGPIESPVDPAFLREGLRRRMWEDPSFGQMSSDGSRVFLIEETPFGTTNDLRRMIVMPDGSRRLDTGSLKSYNNLTAFDAQSGKTAWTLGGPSVRPGGRLAGAYFLGAPMPLGDRLYVVARVDQQMRLIELAAETGDPLWQFVLEAPEEPQQGANGNLVNALGGLNNGGLPLAAETASGPSCDDGVLICPLSENAYVAVDLTTRAVLWIYKVRLDADDPVTAQQKALLLQQQLLQQESMIDDEHWGDSSVTIAGGRVLLTPRDSGHIYCLNLIDGDVRWTAARHDGFYVAAVHDDKVIIVGRGSVWALGLENGEDAWEEGRLPLPAGTMPSGRGFLAGDIYYLPLSSEEVALIDINEGRIIARSKSPDGLVPGNLVRVEDAILSQGADGAHHLDTLEELEKRLAEKLQSDPENAALLTEMGRILLFRGRVAEAVETLLRADQLAPGGAARGLLADALVEGLRIDFDRYVALAEEYSPSADQAEQRARFLREMALARQRSGDLENALDAWLKLISLDAGLQKLDHVSANRTVRRDRWVAARLDDLLAAATPRQTESLEARIALLLDGELSAELFLTYFPFHREANRARLLLAEEKSVADPLAAERLLRMVAGEGSEPQRAEAVARLAFLLKEAERYEEAALAFAELAGPLAGVVCLRGKTGAEIVAELPADEAALAAAPKWPAAAPQFEVQPVNTAISRYLFPLTVARDRAEFSPQWSLDVDNQGRNLVATDPLGRTSWTVDLGAPNPSYRYLAAIYSYGHARQEGHLTVAWVGSRLCAVDGLTKTPRILWTRDTISKLPANPNLLRLRLGMRVPRQPGTSPAAERLALAVGPDFVCFQQDRSLIAVEPLSGETLWIVDGIADNSDLFGDGQRVYVTPPDAEEALVYSGRDGRELGRRLLPGMGDRLLIDGSHVISTRRDQRKSLLESRNVWTGEVQWERELAADARVSPVSDDELAILDASGALTILSAADGREQISAQLAAAEDLESVIVWRSADRYLVAANVPSEGAFAVGVSYTTGSVPINGQLAAVDRRGGDVIWKQTVADQALRINYPGELPVLVLVNQVRRRKENGQLISAVNLLCLDSRTGETILDTAREGYEGVAPNNPMYELRPDVENAQIELALRNVLVKFSLKEQ